MTKRKRFSRTRLVARESFCVGCGDTLRPGRLIYCERCGTKVDRHCIMCEALLTASDGFLCAGCSEAIEAGPALWLE